MGKSAVAGFFAQRGVRVADTDAIAREVVAHGSPALDEIAGRFGREFVTPDGSLDRARMAKLVFADIEARKKLEAILHPRIRERWQAQLAGWQATEEPLAMVVIPLLYETGAQAELDPVICVACSSQTQRIRLAERGWSEDEINRRNAAQFPIDEKVRRANYVVWNEGSLAATEAQVEALVGRFPPGRAVQEAQRP